MSYLIRISWRPNLSLTPRLAFSRQNINLRLSQAVRSESTAARYSPVGRHFPMYLPAAHNCLNRKQSSLTIHLSTKHSRHYSRKTKANDCSGNKLTKNLKEFLLYTICLVLLFSPKLYQACQYPDLRGWPVELRKHLRTARVGLEMGDKQDVVKHLSSAWKIIQVTPTDALNPDPLVKILSVAEWFADALEKDNQFSEAYSLLVKAIELYETRFQELASVSDADAGINSMDNSKLAEKRHLISIFCKLATLSETCEPNAGGKWLSRAITEMVPLVSLCKGSYGGMITAGLVLEECGVHAPKLLKQLGAQIRSSSDASNARYSERSDKSESHAATDDIDNNNALPLPKWYLSDISSAIAVPLELVGLFAERHGHTDVALFEYRTAASILENTTDFLDEKDFPAAADRVVHLLRTSNRITGLELRLLQSETDPTKWLTRLVKLFSDGLAVCRAAAKAEKVWEILNKKSRKMWSFMTMRETETLNDCEHERKVAMKHKEVREEILEGLGRALERSENSRVWLKQIKGGKARKQASKPVAEWIRSAVVTEEKMAEEVLNALLDETQCAPRGLESFLKVA